MNRARRVAAVLLVTFAVQPIASAAAVPPPDVDPGLLRPPAPPAPAGRTEQRQPCYRAPVLDTAPATGNPLGLDAVWPLTRGAGQTIAVIDTGVARHRLLPHLIGGGDYVSHGDGTSDCDGHGTIVAGIAAAALSSGFGGVAPEAAILAIRQSSTKFATEGGSTGVGDVDSLADAVRTAADLGASVINIAAPACVAATSLPDDGALGAALGYAVDVRNVVVVAAAGNVGAHCPQQETGRADWDGVRSVSTPGWYDDLVLCVGSVGTDGVASDFSLAGPWVDVAAPGENVVSLNPDGQHLVDTVGRDAPLSGTNYAAPLVAGVAALVRSRFPHLTAREVMRRIEDTARPPSDGWNPTVGHGVVDALAAVSAGISPTTRAASAPVSVSAPVSTAADSVPRRLAFGGAAACLTAAVVVPLVLSAWRSRRLGSPARQRIAGD